MKKIFLAAMSLAVLPLLVQAKPTNKELKIGISQEFESLNLLIASTVAAHYMGPLVIRTLNTLDPDAKWYPMLAKQIPTIKNGLAKIVTVDGKKKIVATWEIIDKAKWGDGTDLTCADFQFTLKVGTNNNVSTAERETITLVEKIDFDPKTPRKCIFTYEKAKWDFANLPQFYPLPKHLESEIYEKYKAEPLGYDKNTNYVKNPTNPGLYCGPYVVSEMKLGDHVTMVRNKYFYGPQAKIEKIIFKLIPNTGTLEANLRSGTIDMISNLGLTFDQALALDKKVKAEKLPYDVQFVQSNTYEHIDLNLDNPILKDINVRKALLHAINRDDLVKALFEGKQPPALHFIDPKDPWYTADPKFVKTYRYSKRDADRLLTEAGWKKNDKDGYRYKDGKKLSLSLMSTAGNKTRETVEAYLQEEWKQVGVEITIKNQPGRVFFGETTRKHAFEGMAMYAWASNPENNPRSTQHSKSIPSAKNSYSGQNQPGWVNPKMDAAIDAMDLEFDYNKRLDLAHEMVKYYSEDIPVLPLYYRADISVVPKNLKNFRMSGHQFYETYNAENWSLE